MLWLKLIHDSKGILGNHETPLDFARSGQPIWIKKVWSAEHFPSYTAPAYEIYDFLLTGLPNELIEVEWYASPNKAIIGSDNGLSPDQCQAIIWMDAGLLSHGPLGAYFSDIWIKIKYTTIFIEENDFENVVCKLAATLFQSEVLRSGVKPCTYTRLILGLRPANERRHYKVTPSLIGWAQT